MRVSRYFFSRVPFLVRQQNNKAHLSHDGTDVEVLAASFYRILVLKRRAKTCSLNSLFQSSFITFWSFAPCPFWLSFDHIFTCFFYPPLDSNGLIHANKALVGTSAVREAILDCLNNSKKRQSTTTTTKRNGKGSNEPDRHSPSSLFFVYQAGLWFIVRKERISLGQGSKKGYVSIVVISSYVPVGKRVCFTCTLCHSL